MMKKGANTDRTELKMGSYKLLTVAERLLTPCQKCLTEYVSDLYPDTMHNHDHSYLFPSR